MNKNDANIFLFFNLNDFLCSRKRKSTLTSGDSREKCRIVGNASDCSQGGSDVVSNFHQVRQIGSAFDELLKATVRSSEGTCGNVQISPFKKCPQMAQGTSNRSNPQSIHAGLDQIKLPCPHCDILNFNCDPNILRMHLFTHYIKFWEGKVRKFFFGLI